MTQTTIDGIEQELVNANEQIDKLEAATTSNTKCDNVYQKSMYANNQIGNFCISWTRKQHS